MAATGVEDGIFIAGLGAVLGDGRISAMARRSISC